MRTKQILSSIIALLVTVALVGCTDENATRRTLQDSGFTEIQTGGYAWFACSEDDAFHTAFTATNSAGKPVSGVVCCGWLKSCTVRF
jgi:hypothetical protein